jgi:hypothetical protein
MAAVWIILAKTRASRLLEFGKRNHLDQLAQAARRRAVMARVLNWV